MNATNSNFPITLTPFPLIQRCDDNKQQSEIAAQFPTAGLKDGKKIYISVEDIETSLDATGSYRRPCERILVKGTGESR